MFPTLPVFMVPYFYLFFYLPHSYPPIFSIIPYLTHHRIKGQCYRDGLLRENSPLPEFMLLYEFPRFVNLAFLHPTLPHSPQDQGPVL